MDNFDRQNVLAVCVTALLAVAMACVFAFHLQQDMDRRATARTQARAEACAKGTPDQVAICLKLNP